MWQCGRQWVGCLLRDILTAWQMSDARETPSPRPSCAWFDKQLPALPCVCRLRLQRIPEQQQAGTHLRAASTLVIKGRPCFGGRTGLYSCSCFPIPLPCCGRCAWGLLF